MKDAKKRHAKIARNKKRRTQRKKSVLTETNEQRKRRTIKYAITGSNHNRKKEKNNFLNNLWKTLKLDKVYSKKKKEDN